jgi:hypothetical protein
MRRVRSLSHLRLFNKGNPLRGIFSSSFEKKTFLGKKGSTLIFSEKKVTIQPLFHHKKCFTIIGIEVGMQKGKIFDN